MKENEIYNNKLQKATEQSDNLLKAVDIISSQRISEIKFDKTVNCEIINDTNKKNGEYTVAEGNLSYKVYSEETAYSKGDAVRVQIPEGDYSKKKYILGKQSTDSEDKPISYISPLDTVLKLTDNLLETNHQGSKWELIANGDQTEISIGVIDLTTDVRAKNSYNNNIYNTATIEAKFSTFLDKQDVREGSYGIRIEFRFLNKKGLSRTESVRLDTKNMFGNPYRFKIPAYQAKAFSLLEIDELESIQLFFYQNKDFKYQKEGTLKILPCLEDVPTLFVSDVAFGFGSNIDSIPDNSAELYSVQGLEYTDKDYQRDIGLLWYNKTEENVYLGFSDGVYDPKYDELKYLSQKNELSRLATEASKEEIPKTVKGLDVSADLTKLKSLVEEIINIADSDLPVAIRGFQSSMSPITGQTQVYYDDPYKDPDIEDDDRIKLSDYVARLVGNSQDTPGSLAKYVKDLETIFFNEKEGIIPQYKNFLKGIAETKKPGFPPAITLRKYTTFIFDIAKLLTLGTKEFDDLTSKNFYFLGEGYRNTVENAYGGYWSVYETYNINIWKNFEKIKSATEEIEKLLSALENKAKEIYNNDEEYKNDKLKQLEEDNKNRYCIYWYRFQKDYYNPDEEIMGQGWEQLTDKMNVGLPRETIVVKGVTYYAIKSVAANTLSVTLDTNLDEEKYLAVIYYNHEQIKTQPITFTRVAAEGEEDVDTYGVLSLAHDKSSQDTYQFYGEDGYLLRQSEAHIKRKIKFSFKSAYQTEDNLIGSSIYWYVPKNASMISYAKSLNGKKYDASIYEDFNFSDTKNGIPQNYYKEGYVVFNKILGGYRDTDGKDKLNESDLYFTYVIDDYYIPTHTNNTIICRIVKGNKTFEASINFVFASYGIDGTEYSLVVKPSGSQVAVTPSAPLELSIKLFDYTNEEIPLYKEEPTEVKGLYGYNLKMQFIKLEKGEDGHSIPPPAITEIRGTTGKDIVGCTLTNAGGKEGISYGLLQISTRVKLRQTDEESTKEVVIDKIYPVAWAANPSYFIDGAISILYDTNGSNPKFYNNPYRLFKDGVEVTFVAWSINNEKNDSDDKISLPSLDSKRILIPKPLYTEASKYRVVKAQITDEETKNSIVAFCQPINIEMDRYNFKKLNEWDGSFQINEEEGTILSSLVAAGSKNINNQFTGVVLGEMLKLGGKETTSGLYGFHEGAGAFAFKNDGTAFIGKSGQGRIVFNGKESAIQSGNYKENFSGMKINLYEGTIETPNFKVSKNGTITATNGEFSGKVTSSSFIGGNIFVPNITSPKFSVDEEGIMTCVDGIFSGNINLKTGQKISFQNNDNTSTVYLTSFYWSTEGGESSGTESDDGILCKGWFQVDGLLEVNKDGIFNKNLYCSKDLGCSGTAVITTLSTTTATIGTLSTATATFDGKVVFNTTLPSFQEEGENPSYFATQKWVGDQGFLTSTEANKIFLTSDDMKYLDVKLNANNEPYLTWNERPL